MVYAIINFTSYGTGYEQVGTFRSLKRAEKIRQELAKYASGEDSYSIVMLRALDSYTDDSIVQQYKIEG